MAQDLTVDVLVVGTGGTGLSAAIAAKDAGADVLVIEGADRWGGTTMRSGGGLWLPANPVMLREGLPDTKDEALEYLQEAVGDVGPASSKERREAFVDAIPAVVTRLEELGVRWAAAKDYPDYYPERPGGKVGRSIEPRPFDAKRLGDWFKQSRYKDSVPAPAMNDDFWELSRAWSTPSGFVRGARLVFRTLGGVATGKRLFGMGGALVMSLMKVVQDQATPVRLSTRLVELVADGSGAVTGAVVEGPEGRYTVTARGGVVLGAGGFAHRTEWRQKYHGVPGWSAAAESDLGTAIEAGVAVGGALDLMDDAWWGAGIDMHGEGMNGFILSERSMPYGLVVDQTGQRYVNESTSYIDFGHAMLERDAVAPAVPSWLIHDVRFRRRYLNNAALAGAKKLKANGSYVFADTIEELAEKIGVDPTALAATMRRFNGFARTGVDQDFQRGASLYDRYYADPSVRPNPNLGPLEKGPFSALRIVPGDLGTKGGLLTDEHARVLREDGGVIPGLYAAGNTSASVMGRTYPGPGSTIGPAVVFGWIAAAHAARRR